MEYKILRYRLIQELSTPIISLPFIEMLASPTALQDNSWARKNDEDQSTKKAVQDNVELTSPT